jgi:hypothetical protein
VSTFNSEANTSNAIKTERVVKRSIPQKDDLRINIKII